MASAHYFFRNYDIKQVINLMCYMTEFPHTLTSTQKITRMYRYTSGYAAASSGEKNSGQSTKTDAIPLITTEIFRLPGRSLNLYSTSPKTQPSLHKPSNISNKGSGTSSTPP